MGKTLRFRKKLSDIWKKQAGAFFQIKYNLTLKQWYYHVWSVTSLSIYMFTRILKNNQLQVEPYLHFIMGEVSLYQEE